MAKTNVKIANAAPVTAPILCDVPWTPEDAGSTLAMDVLRMSWTSPTSRPCGLKHTVIDKKWCAYRCEHGKVKEQ